MLVLNTMKNKIRYTLYALITLAVIYRIGPHLIGQASDDQLPLVKYEINSVERYVNDHEAQYDIKADNAAHIVWADSAKQKTEYVLLYLHGFSASWYEGYPVNKAFADSLNCNAYYARLAEHGLQDDKALLHMTPKRLYDSAKEALLIAHTLGQKVIIMSTSTGGTLSLMLAADFPDLVDALVMYSPNIRIRQKAAQLLANPWGLKVAELSEGGNMRHIEASELTARYWYLDYRVEAMVYLQQLLNERMDKFTFEKVSCPVFVGYYYKDKQHQDDVVSVEAILKMYDRLGSTTKQMVNFPNAGQHTIAFVEAGSTDVVLASSLAFAKKYIMN